MSAVEMLAKARRLMSQRDVPAGMQALRDTVAKFPRYAEAWSTLSGTQTSLGLALASIASAKQALALEPDNVVYRAHLAQQQVNYGLWNDAVETLAPLMDKSPSTLEPKIANAIGSVLSLCGKEEEAQPWFTRAAQSGSDNRNYLYNEAQGLLHCGRLNEAQQAFERLLARAPDYARAHWSLAGLKAKAATSERVEATRRALTRAGSPQDEVYYCYALFMLLEAMQQPRDAYVELEHGMRLQRALLRYSGQDVALLRRIGETATRLFSSPPHDTFGADTGTTPIFIVGLPRSGTTLVERILTNQPGVAQGGEFVCFSAALREQLDVGPATIVSPELLDKLARGPVDLAAAGRRYLELTAYKHRGHAFFTDKLPFNFMLVPWILRALPQAKILHIRRDPIDTCFSNLKQLFASTYAACYSQQDIAEYYQAYHALMKLWDRMMPGRILHVSYEQLVADPQAGSRRLLAFCGLDDPGDAWRIENNPKPVATASTLQVRAPINDRSIGAWRRYEQELQPLARFFAAHPELSQ